jgi:hypothetical protein
VPSPGMPAAAMPTPMTPPPAAAPASAWRRSVDGLLGSLRSGPAPKGGLEVVEVGPTRVAIRGWAERAGGAATGFTLRIAGRPVAVAALDRLPRGGPAGAAAPQTGFRLVAASPVPIAAGTPAVPIIVTARFDAGSSLDMSLPENTPWLVAGAADPAVPARAAKRKPGGRPAPRVPDSPSMPAEAVALLTEALGGAGCYLEYGSGGSTVLATGLGVPVIVSVESDRAWLELVRAKVGAKAETEAEAGRHVLLHADIGPTKALGHTVSDEHWRNYRNYPLGAWEVCRSRGLAPEVILVDGRFRVACCLASLLFAKPGARILFDDYLERPHYHTVEAFGTPTRMVGRLAEFTVPASLERDAVWLALVAAIPDQR